MAIDIVDVYSYYKVKTETFSYRWLITLNVTLKSKKKKDDLLQSAYINSA